MTPKGGTAGVPLNYQLVAAKGLWTFHASRLTEKERNHHFGNGAVDSDHQETGGNSCYVVRMGRATFGAHVIYLGVLVLS